MTLWSRLKTYFQMKPFGASCLWTASACTSAIIALPCHAPASARSPSPASPEPCPLLLRGHILQPFLEILFRHNLEERPHFVVPEATELIASDLEPARLCGREVDGDLHAGDHVLLNPQLA